jgi:hypothetical protein
VQFNSFTDVLALDDVHLHTLLERDGDGPERVWAAWALGLSHDASAAEKSLGQSLAREPVPGVRAHFALMLVASGQREAAMVLAKSDPAEIVRATAYRCLARMASPEDASLNSLLSWALAAEPAPDVRIALIDGLRTDAPSHLQDGVAELLRAPDVTLRGAAIDFALRRTEANGALTQCLRARAPSEENDELLGLILDVWMRREGRSSLLFAMHSWPSAGAERALAYCVAKRIAIPWGELSPLFARAEALIDARLAGLAQAGLTSLPVEALLLLILRFTRECRRHVPDGERPPNQRWPAATFASTQLTSLLRRMDSLREDEQAMAAELLAHLDSDVVRASEEFAIDAAALELYRERDEETESPLEEAQLERIDETIDAMSEEEQERFFDWVYGTPLGRSELRAELRRLTAAPASHERCAL